MSKSTNTSLHQKVEKQAALARSLAIALQAEAEHHPPWKRRSIDLYSDLALEVSEELIKALAEADLSKIKKLWRHCRFIAGLTLAAGIGGVAEGGATLYFDDSEVGRCLEQIVTLHDADPDLTYHGSDSGPDRASPQSIPEEPAPDRETGTSALHAYVSDDAHNHWHGFAAQNDISVSSFLEAFAPNLDLDSPISHSPWRDQLMNAIATARKIDMQRRRRRRQR